MSVTNTTSFRDVLSGLRADHFSRPEDQAANLLTALEAALLALSDALGSNEQVRVGEPGSISAAMTLPEGPAPCPADVAATLVRGLLAGAVNWMSPRLFHNVGTAPCIAALAAQGATAALNTYAINDDLAGRAMDAERHVASILADLAGLDSGRVAGIFSFGGTATNLYAMRLGLRKAVPASSRTGLRDARVKLAITVDAHFSHTASADWLGVGSEDLIIMEADGDRTSNLENAEAQMCEAIEAGFMVPAIVINGGTTYDHAIDDVAGFVDLRDRLIATYGLTYRPHLHVDSVIGWAWLCFRTYDFEVDPLNFGPDLSSALACQADRISTLRGADSWGVDFHKGVGSCPVDCSVFVLNDRNDLSWLSKSASGGSLHQLNPGASRLMPADVTLETSRSAGKSMAALGALQGLGLNGYRALLANLVENTLLLRTLMNDQQPGSLQVLGNTTGAYVTMVRMLPPGMRPGDDIQVEDPVRTDQISRYMAAFDRWDRSTRSRHGLRTVEYSYSSRYRRTDAGRDVPAVKFYPTSPYLDASHVREAVAHFVARQAAFDSLQGDRPSQAG
jgi:L-2,4-diaminobutyrate decarboxylase